MWVRSAREEGHAVHGKAIQAKAREIADDFYGGYVKFEASGGWLSRFLRRSGLVSRRVTTEGQGMPANAADVVKKFLRDAGAAVSS